MVHSRVLALLAAALAIAACSQMPAGSGGDVPTFRADPAWPAPLAEKDGQQMVFGQVAGIAVNPADNHIWVIHRPSTLLPDEMDVKTGKSATHRCCVPMPPVAEFDAQGRFLRGWGGPGSGYQWPKSEHGIFIDGDGNVWIAGNSEEDHQILKFTPDGRFLMQVGHAGKSEGSNSTTQLGRPAHMIVTRGELFVADGYGNRRVIVFDAATGAYKRHWGAYGERPHDDKLPAYDPKAPLSRSFANPVHCVRMSNDELLYVCDRQNNRIQVFNRAGQFQREFRVEPDTLANGAAWDMVLSHDPAQKYMYVADGANGRVYILRRSDGQTIGQFGRTGRMPGEFKWCTTSPSTPTATCTPRRSGSGGAHSGSCAPAAPSDGGPGPRLSPRSAARSCPASSR